MFKKIIERFSKRKRLAKKQPEVLRYEELEQRVLFSADVVPGLDTAVVEEQVIVQDVDSEVQAERGAAPETVEQPSEETRSELVLVNENVTDYEQLIADLQANDDNRIIETVVLDAERDGIEQVSEILSERTNLAAVHVITHGADGAFSLGGDWLNNADLLANSETIAAWGDALSEDADILLYGCNVAADVDGQNLTDTLAVLTGADVAASDDKTGHEDLGADWDLEYQTDAVEASTVLDDGVPWEHTLGVVANQAPWTNLAVTTDRSTTISETYTVTATPGSDRLLLATMVTRFGFDQTIDVTSASFGGVQMHEIVEGSSDTTRNGVWMGYLLDSEIPAGEQTMTVSFTSTVSDPTGTKLLAATYVGVDQTAPINDSSANNTKLDAPISFGSQIDYVAGAEVVYVASFGGNTNTNTTEPAGYSKIYTNEWSGLLMTTIGHRDDTATAGYSPDSTAVDFEGTDANHSIAVVALNPAGVNNAPEITSNGGGATVSINVAENTTAVTTVTATDADLDTLTYSISGGADAAKFDLIGGVLTFKSAPDFESPGDVGANNTYEVEVTADDGNGGTDVQTINVTVTNVAPTTLTTTGTGSVSDGGLYTLNLSADEDVTSWTINWGDGAIETIAGNPSSATHTYNGAGITHNILVAATDADGTYLQNELLVPTYYGGEGVLRFAPTTGQFVEQLAMGDGLVGHFDLQQGPDGNLYVTGYNSGNVLRYAPDGTFINTFVSAGSGGLNNATSLLFGPDGHLYVAGADSVLRYDGATGAFLNAFVAANSGGLSEPAGMEFGSDGNLYVASYNTNEVLRYNGSTGAFIDVFVSDGAGGLSSPEQIAFGPDGNLYVANSGGDNVLRYNGATGVFMDEFVAAGAGGLDYTTGLAFGPDGNLYVTSQGTDNVLRYDGTSGAFIDSYVATGAGGLDVPAYLSFLAEHQVTVNGNVAPVISLPGSALDYTEGDGAVVIDATASVSDTDSANFDTGTLTVEFSANGTANDRLAIRDQGSGIGNIQVSENNISYQPGGSSILIGIFAGGTDGSTPLVITLNAAADSAAVQALMRNITYENISDNPSTLTRTVRFVLTDGDGGTSTAVTENINVTAVNDAPTFIDGSIGNWNFDEGSGDSIVESAIGISTGTLGSTAGADANDPTWTTGKFGQALHFDGVEDYVEIADAPGIDISGSEFSASLWVKPDRGPDQEDMFFMKGDRQGIGNVNYYLSWKDTNKMTWAFKSDGGFEYLDIDVTLPTVGEWNHIAVVFNRPTVSLYINGTEYTFNNVATGGTSMDKDLVANDEPLWIGAGRDGGDIVTPGNYSAPFSGAIDEFAIFDRALTGAEIEAIRTSTPPAVTASAFSIDENSADNTVVGTVVANDQDIGDTLSYAITAGNTGGAFSIDANGQIKVANSTALDFETNPTFNLIIEATDDGSPNLSDTMTVTITLVNVDDAPVQVNNTGSTVTEGGTDTLTNTELRYDDSEQPASSVTYSVTGGLANGQLELTTDPGTAVTSFTQDDIDNNRLIYVHDDSETTNDSFNFTVDDGQGNSVTGQYFAITVTPVNDAPVAREDRVGLTFDGVDDYVRIGDYPGLTLSNSVTMEAWIRPSGAGTGTQIIVNKEGEYEFAITSDTGEIKWSFANTDPGWGWHNTGYFAQAGEWTHIAVTYNNGVVTTYADGALVDTYNGTGVIADQYPAFNELQIGGRENAVTQRFDGLIDEVRVWNTERTQIEIQTNMNTLLAGNETGLLGNWRFDEGSGTTVTDQSVNGHHGTLADGVTVAEMPNWEGYVVSEDGTLNVSATNGVLSNDFDIDGDPLTAVLDGGPSNAVYFTLSPDGSFTYTPVANFNGVDTFTYHANDGSADSNIVTVTIRVDPMNDVPVINNATFNLDENSTNGTVVGTVPVTDPDAGDTHVYSITAGNTSGAFTIDNAGNITVANSAALNFETVPVFTLTVQAQDQGGTGLIDTATITVNLNDINDTPVLGAIGNQTVDELATLTFTATATDADLPADTLTYSLDAASIALGMSIDANTGVFSWTPTEAQGGMTPSVNVTVTDNGTGNLVDSETFTITVNDINIAPVLDPISNQTVDELATLTFSATATDADLPVDTLTFSLDAASVALGMTIDSNTGVFSWTPTEAQGGTTPSVTVTVTDNGTGNLVDSETFTITVNDINVAPVLGAIGNQTVDELNALTFTATATDADLPADTLTYSLDAASIALGMSIDANTGVFTWTPTEGLGGITPSVTVTVTDNGTGNLVDSETFTITVNDTNVAPVLAAIGNQTVDELATLTFIATATDADLPADTLTFSLDAASIALGMSIDANTGVFTWTPTEAQGGLTPSVTVTVTDNGTGNLVDSETFTITVNGINVAPVLGAIGNQTVDELATLTFTATATDSDLPADTLTFSLDAASIALGMGIDANTGVFSWTPTEAQGGSTPSVTVTVTDNGTGSLVDSETFTITVNDVNVAPVLGAIGNQTVDELSTLTFTATATDADLPADTLTFSLDAASIALGMSIDANTGVFTWTPTESQGGLTPSVTITVTDNGTGNLVDSETFTITVNDINVTPVLGAIGNQTVDELTTLSFTATATDADLPADNLTFSLDAASIALGMTIDANTGVFSWTPTEAQGGLTPSVTITVTDNGTGNLVDSETFTITVNDINTAPVLAAIGNQTVDELATLNFTATATDADLPADTLTFSLDAASIALGMSIDANTGVFSWTPTEGQGGLTPSVTVTVTDSGTGNLVDSETFTITVNDINVSPVLGAIGNQTVDEMVTMTFTATATDSDLPADTLTYSLDAASIALGMTIDANTGVFTWTPAEGQGGMTPSVTITVTDSGTGNLVDSETFTITVNDINVAPVLSAIGNQTVDELATLTFTATATDADLPTDTLTYSLDAASLALGMSINANTGVFSWIPTEGQGGLTPSVTITVTDDGSGNLVDNETFTITVNEINVAPVLGVIGNQTVDELATLTFTATATDADLPADTLTFSLDAASLALGMSIDANTGVFTWTPTEAQGGLTPSVTVTVTDSGTGNLTDSETFTITVNDTNTAPVLGAIGNQTVDELATLTFTATATDSDLPADTLTFSLDAASIALGMNIDANTGVFSWTPTEAQGGLTPSVTVTVTDDGTGNLVDSETFTITVNGDNSPPVLGVIGDQTVDELATLTFTATATDADVPADTLTFSLDAASIALGMTIDANTGDFSWTPTEAQGGLTPSVTVTVTDSGTGNLTDSETFTITVNDINVAPVLGAIGNQTVDELSTLTFTATATDADLPADTLTYSLDAASIALGMTIDANTGVFTWTPTESQGGLTPSVTITVTDSGTGNLTDSETFTITVNDINVPPVLGAIGNQTVDELATLTFTATATDSDLPADTLTYSLDAASVALGMTIDANTGAFSWTPTESQGGLTPSVTITVTDNGTGNLVDNETFTITVNDINVAPVINNATFALDENSTNGTAVGTVPVTDPDTGDTHVYSITAGNTGGAFAIDNTGNITVANSTALNFETTPLFTLTVQVQDQAGTGLVDTATITVNLNNLNEAPISSGIANVTVSEDAPNTVIDLFAAFADTEDADASLTYTITANTNPGLFAATLIDGVAGTLTLDYAPNANGTANITVRATDTSALWVESTFTVTVNPVNDAPATTSVTLTAIGEDGGGRLITQAELLANAADVDGPALTATNLTISAGSGTLVDNGDGTWDYIPAANDDTSVSFTYTVTDGSLTATGSASLDITPVNDTPVTNNDSATVDEGQNVVINLVGNDADAENALDLNSITITAAPTNGSLVDNGDGTLTYTHDGSKTISDRFSYSINDVSGAASNIAAVSLTVNPANDNDPVDSTNPNPILEDPVTDEDEESDTEDPTYEAPGEDPLAEDEPLLLVEEYQAPEDSGDADDSIVVMKDLQDEEIQEIIYLTDEIDRNTQPEERDDDRGYTYYDNDLYKDMSSLKYWNLIDNTAQSGPVAVNLDDISFLDFDSEDNDQVILDEDYDALRQEIDESFDTELKGQSIKAKIVTATAATFTVGIVSYLLRAGSLVASMMSALPLWRGFDPIAIFSGKKKKKKKQNEISDTGQLKPEAFFDGDAE